MFSKSNLGRETKILSSTTLEMFLWSRPFLAARSSRECIPLRGKDAPVFRLCTRVMSSTLFPRVDNRADLNWADERSS